MLRVVGDKLVRCASDTSARDGDKLVVFSYFITCFYADSFVAVNYYVINSATQGQYMCRMMINSVAPTFSGACFKATTQKGDRGAIFICFTSHTLSCRVVALRVRGPYLLCCASHTSRLA